MEHFQVRFRVSRGSCCYCVARCGKCCTAVRGNWRRPRRSGHRPAAARGARAGTAAASDARGFAFEPIIRPLVCRSGTSKAMRGVRADAHLLHAVSGCVIGALRCARPGGCCRAWVSGAGDGLPPSLSVVPECPARASTWAASRKGTAVAPRPGDVVGKRAACWCQ